MERDAKVPLEAANTVKKAGTAGAVLGPTPTEHAGEMASSYCKNTIAEDAVTSLSHVASMYRKKT